MIRHPWRVAREAARSAALLLACGCAAVGAGGGPGSSRRGPFTHREDRVLLSSATNILGMAASQRYVFAATPDELLVLDRQFHRWLPPVGRETNYPGGNVTEMAADPLEDGVWVAVPGELVYYRATGDYLTTTIVPGVVDAMMFDQRDPISGIYIRSSGEWLRVSHTGAVDQVGASALPPPGARVVPAGIRDIVQQYPSIQNFATLLTRDESMQSWPITSGAEVPGTSEVWLGTRGGGVFKVDPNFNQSEHVPFGLLETGAGAVALAADGIWVAGLGQGFGRGGLTFASADLQEWRWLEGPTSRPLAGARAFDLDVRGTAAWVATDRGVARMDTQNPNSFRLWNLGNRLPADVAYSVVATPAGAWVGTASGLVFIADGGRPAAGAAPGVVTAPIASGTAIHALLLTGDTLWIGSDQGLLLLRGAAPDSLPRRAAASAQDSRLLRPIRALARSDSEVVVATQDELLRFDVQTGRLLPAYDAVTLSRLGGIMAVAMDATTIWAAGPGGVMLLTRATGVPRFLSAPGEVPGEAYDVQLDPDFAWIATSAGVLRLHRLSDGTVP